MIDICGHVSNHYFVVILNIMKDVLTLSPDDTYFFAYNIYNSLFILSTWVWTQALKCCSSLLYLLKITLMQMDQKDLTVHLAGDSTAQLDAS